MMPTKPIFAEADSRCTGPAILHQPGNTASARQYCLSPVTLHLQETLHQLGNILGELDGVIYRKPLDKQSLVIEEVCIERKFVLLL